MKISSVESKNTKSAMLQPFGRAEIQLVYDLIKPETAIERAILQHPEWMEGALWGEPRWGHPEGQIIYHIEEVLKNVEIVAPHFPQLRSALRLITITHDTFKFKEEQTRPRQDWSKHHAVFAARFSEQFIKDQRLINIIELHDEAYYAWIHAHFHDEADKAENRLQNIFEQVNGDLQLFYLFFKCDTRTGDKTQLPVEWFEAKAPKLELIDF